MKVARFREVGKIDILEEPIPVPPAGEITVKVRTSGICGTDHHVYTGNVTGLVKKGTVLKVSES